MANCATPHTVVFCSLLQETFDISIFPSTVKSTRTTMQVDPALQEERRAKPEHCIPVDQELCNRKITERLNVAW
jgi:hypothetical protein